MTVSHSSRTWRLDACMGGAVATTGPCLLVWVVNEVKEESNCEIPQAGRKKKAGKTDRQYDRNQAWPFTFNLCFLVLNAHIWLNTHTTRTHTHIHTSVSTSSPLFVHFRADYRVQAHVCAVFHSLLNSWRSSCTSHPAALSGQIYTICFMKGCSWK